MLGVSAVVTLSGPAVQLAADQELLTELVGAFRRTRPDIVYVPHQGEDDPTHQVAAQLVREARWLSACPILPDAGPPLAAPARTVYEYEVWTPLARPAVSSTSRATASGRRALWPSTPRSWRSTNESTGRSAWPGTVE